MNGLGGSYRHVLGSPLKYRAVSPTDRNETGVVASEAHTSDE